MWLGIGAIVVVLCGVVAFRRTPEPRDTTVSQEVSQPGPAPAAVPPASQPDQPSAVASASVGLPDVPVGAEPAPVGTVVGSAPPACDYYAGEPDPQYVMRSGYIDWAAYWERANSYALQRSARYTPEEQLLAKAIWSEQKTDATTPAEREARRKAMIAIGYVILHRRDQIEGWFGSTNTLTEVLEDTRQDIQFQGYWKWRTTNVVQDYILYKEHNGVVVQPGIGWESPDRAVWFEALDVARGVLWGCEPDMMPDSLYFGHGPGVQQMMQQRAQQDSEFVYQGIVGPDLWMSNKPFRR